jgi:hypothetical protein
MLHHGQDRPRPAKGQGNPPPSQGMKQPTCQPYLGNSAGKKILRIKRASTASPGWLRPEARPKEARGSRANTTAESDPATRAFTEKVRVSRSPSGRRRMPGPG